MLNRKEKIDRKSPSDDIRTELVNCALLFHEQCLALTFKAFEERTHSISMRTETIHRHSHSYGSATSWQKHGTRYTNGQNHLK